jgi:tricorn protease
MTAMLRLLLAFVSFVIIPASAFADNGYYRFPALSGDQIIFTAEGDLWSTASSGGKAQRLTTHPGQEVRAVVSPNGKLIAFNGSYDGLSEVYVMPMEGGVPKRLTFDSGNSVAIGWSPAGEVLYATQNETGPASQRVMALVDPASLKRRILPLADAGDAAFSADGQTLYFVRFGLAISNDNVRNYRGGLTAHLWRYALKGDKEAERIAGAALKDANDRRPMVWDNRIYFISDRSGRDNLWSMAPDGSDLKQLTKHNDFDLRWANLDKGRIVYQLGADIHVFDIAANVDKIVPIDLTGDFAQRREHVVKNPLAFFEAVSFSPKGDRIAVTARGHVALAGTGVMRRIDLGTGTATRLRNAIVSADGKSVFGFSDASGEVELWRYSADGSADGKQLTKDAAGVRTVLSPSPDGKWIAHATFDGRAFLYNLETGQNAQFDSSDWAEIGQLVWSPDSKAIVIVRPDGRSPRNRLVIYNLAERKKQVLTSDKYDSEQPAFSPDGKWLYFLSDRQFQTQSGVWRDRDMGPGFTKRTKIYAMALQAGLKFPFDPPTEADNAGDAKVADKPAADKDKEKDKDKDAKAPKAVPAIQYEGLGDRLFEVPLPGDDISSLNLDDKRLYFLGPDGAEGHSALKTLTIETTGPKPDTFMADVREYELSADRKKIMIRKFVPAPAMGDVMIVDAGAKAPADLSKSGVKLGDWSVIATPALEWKQMFFDAWRMHRDYFYDKSLKGVDWSKVRDHFAPLVDRLTDRAELDDLLGQMTSELSTLHSQVIPGDQRNGSDGSTAGFLGAIFDPDPQGFKIAHIYRTEQELPAERGPLSAPGVDAREGDIITAVNGVSAAGRADIGDLLRDRVGQQVLLSIKRAGKDIKTVAIAVNAQRQAGLRYGDWEQSRRAKVDAASQGRIGYLHLRAMGGEDAATFAREFFANIDRDGLIIDVRRNNGGNIDSWIIDRLMRRTWAYLQPRYGKYPIYNMQNTFRGKVAVLIDERTYSDGETFAAGIKALKVAPLIGKRTSGAGVWLSDRSSLADRGRARVAELGQFAADTNEQLVEGKGVTPDIEVENPPHETFTGSDRQLETAIKTLLDQMPPIAKAKQ